MIDFEDEEEEHDEELALMVKKFRKMARNISNSITSSNQSMTRRKTKTSCAVTTRSKGKSSLIILYKKKKKNKGKYEKYKKALKVETLDDTEESHKDYANICLMTNSELDEEIEGCHSEVPDEVYEYIEELC